MTPQAHEESLRELNVAVCGLRERIKNVVDHHCQSFDGVVAKTCELALRPEFEAILTARSHLTGKKVNCRIDLLDHQLLKAFFEPRLC